MEEAFRPEFSGYSRRLIKRVLDKSGVDHHEFENLSPEMRRVVWDIGLQELKEEQAENSERTRRTHRKPESERIAESADSTNNFAQADGDDTSAAVNLTIGVMRTYCQWYSNNGFLEQAVQWLRKAANAGHLGSQVELAQLYHDGDEIAQDFSEAAKWYEKAANQGDCQSQYNLGICFLKGRGVEQNFTKAAHWFSQARANRRVFLVDGMEIEPDKVDRSYSIYELADLTLKGLGVNQNTERAVELLEEAADLGCMSAANDLGVSYCDGTLGEPDFTSAVKWFRKSADDGYWHAQRNLALCYWNGEGVEEDSSMAFEWMKRAADNQWFAFSDSHFMLGWFYEDGIGTDADTAEAVKWYYKAAVQGHQGAAERLREHVSAIPTTSHND